MLDDFSKATNWRHVLRSWRVTCVCGELATLPPTVLNPVFVGHGLQAASGATSIPLLVASMHVAAEEKVLSLLLLTYSL